MPVKPSCIALLFTLLSTAAHAHQIWIEPAGRQFNVHFGEYDENLKEVSPGLLDKMPPPAVLSGDKDVAVSKGKDAYAVELKPAEGSAVVAEVRNYPAFERKDGDRLSRVKWVPAARYVGSFAVQAPKNFLDIVPNGDTGKFKLYFRGQPLAKAKLTLVAPNGWQKPLQSDERGEFEAPTLWQGLYVIEVQHKETQPGEIDGEKYDAASFTSTVSFMRKQGPATPRPEPAKPHQQKQY